VLPSVQGCPDTLVTQAIRTAAINFSTRTDIIQRIITADCTATVEDYVVTPPTDMLLMRILAVSWQGVVLGPASPDIINKDVVLRGANVGAAQVVNNDPQFWFMKTVNDSGFSLYPIPIATVTLGLTVKATFVPSQSAATLDSVLFDDWVDEIAAGAIEILMLIPGQPWSSQSGRAYGIQYERAVNRAKRAKNAGYLPGSLRVMPNPFCI